MGAPAVVWWQYLFAVSPSHASYEALSNQPINVTRHFCLTTQTCLVTPSKNAAKKAVFVTHCILHVFLFQRRFHPVERSGSAMTQNVHIIQRGHAPCVPP